MRYLIAIDLGGTNIVCGLLDASSMHVIRTTKLPTDSKLGYHSVLKRIADMVNEMITAMDIRREQIIAIGAGIPGLINPDLGISILSSNLQWSERPVAKDLTELTNGIPTFIDNDVRMFALGEAMKGAGQGFQHILGLTLGTGMAAGIVQNGKLMHGGGYMAGEIGHIRIEHEHTLCGCGQRGCLETIASATGIARLAKERVLEGESSILAKWVDDAGQLTAAHVSQAYDQGDPVSIEIMNYVGKCLGRVLAYAIYTISPDVIVIGGGAGQAGERILKPLRAELSIYLIPQYMQHVQIKQSELGDNAGLIGSAYLALHSI